MTARLSLAQQIAQLEETTPADFDPEDLQINGADIDSEDNEPAEDNQSGARAHYLDVGPSALRKSSDSVADPKYDGTRTTRKQLLESDGELSELDDEEFSSKGEGDIRSSADEENEDLPSQSEASKKEATSNVQHHDADPQEDQTSTLRKTRDEDRKKGKAVSQQIAIWDLLLDARIRLQKSATATNRLPHKDLSLYSTMTEGRESVDKFLEEAMLLSDEIFELQENLLISNESIQPPPRKRRRNDDATIDHASQIQKSSQSLSALEHVIHPHLIQTLSKWSSKIQAVAPSVLLPSNRGAFSKSYPNQHLKSVVQLIDETLHAGMEYEKLLARTRVHRSKGSRIGGDQDEMEMEAIASIFDDTDFYQQLLRDVIDARKTGHDGIGADDWIASQKQKKARKKVDTKASKGRKIRYDVHEKLQNFMVPIPIQGGWHDEQIDELFASLLGKGFENVGGTYAEPEHEPDSVAESNIEEALKGFRVFG